MKISVIVPIYNTSKYLEQCLLSIQNQTMKDIEVICVNDGSTDESQRIIDHFVQTDDRFHCIRKQNTGYGHSVNLGIRNARAPYVGIVESDDFVESVMYEKLYDAIEKSGADFVKADYYEYIQNTNNVQETEGKHEDNRIYYKLMPDIPYGEVFSPQEYPQVFGVHPSVWSALYRKSFLVDNGIAFAQTPGASYQDIDFNFKLFTCAERIYFLEEAVLNYRVSNLDSSIHNPAKIFCVCDEIKDIEEFVEKRKQEGKLSAEWQDMLATLQMWILFRNYMWNYNKLSGAYQYTFLLEMYKAFSRADIDRLEADVWSEWERKQFSEVVQDLNAFFDRTAKGYQDPRMEFLPVLNYTFPMLSFERYTGEVQDIYIYGAGKIGHRVLQFLEQSSLKNKVRGILVSEKEGNPAEIDGIPVWKLEDFCRESDRKGLILIALQKNWHYEIARKLTEYGFTEIICIDDSLKKWIYENTNV